MQSWRYFGCGRIKNEVSRYFRTDLNLSVAYRYSANVVTMEASAPLFSIQNSIKLVVCRLSHRVEVCGQNSRDRPLSV